MNETFNSILNNQINLFLAEIEKQVNNNTREHRNYSVFSILYPQKSEETEYGFFSSKLGFCVNDQLVTGVLSRWLKAIGYKCFVPVNKTYYRVRLFERRSIIAPPYIFPFLFILEIDNRRIGYGTFSSLNKYLNSKINHLLIKYNISEIIILDASRINSSRPHSNISIDSGIFKKELNVTSLEAFFDKYFSQELYNHYLSCVRQAIEKAYKVIGYQTISNLSIKHLSYFKENIINQLYDFNIRTISYQEFDQTNGELTQTFQPLLDTKDYNIIIDCCYTNKLLEVLCGKAKFARCFLTSEHLYSIFKSDNQNYYDFSTIVSGYYKSVELLLEEAMEATFSHPDHEKLWIKGRKHGKKDIDWRHNPDPNAKGTQTKFIRNNSEFFSDEMGSLIWFLHDNPSDWLVSKQSREIIHKCLRNYNSGCRNEHLHKDIISDINTVEAVRTNTILCLLYILGGYQFYNSKIENFQKLGGENHEYNRLNKAISSMPKSVRNFYIKFKNQEEIMVNRLNKQPDTEFDEYGNVISEIQFITVTSFDNDDDDYAAFTGNIDTNKILTISKDHMPEEIYWYNNAAGKNKID